MKHSMEVAKVVKADVLVIGGAAVDIVGSLTEDLHMGISNPSRIRTSYGGVARNLAENISRRKLSALNSCSHEYCLILLYITFQLFVVY